MRITRSSTRGMSNAVTVLPPESTVNRKRKVSTTEAPQPRKKPQPAVSAALNTTGSSSSSSETKLSILPATLTFSFNDAKSHLIAADSRFEEIFSRLPCKPYEDLDRVEPFRTLTTSILSQQISWLAARSIVHRFKRLFDSTLPEVLPPPGEDSELRSPTSFFPSPREVASQDIAILRTAGLSQRKAEYVKDLAARFADGRLSAEKILNANDEDLATMLIEVRGIGKWTVDMFAIFSLRRPDILPVGDLGVQKGVLKWILSLHSPENAIEISPKKLPKSSSQADAEGSDDEEGVVGPSDGSPATPVKNATSEGLAAIPPPFTPSISRVLHSKHGQKPELPLGLTVAELKARLAGKKKIKGAFLSPQEMEQLTDHWRPYRSLGVFYMWSLAGTTEPKKPKSKK